MGQKLDRNARIWAHLLKDLGKDLDGFSTSTFKMRLPNDGVKNRWHLKWGFIPTLRAHADGLCIDLQDDLNRLGYDTELIVETQWYHLWFYNKYYFRVRKREYEQSIDWFFIDPAQERCYSAKK